MLPARILALILLLILISRIYTTCILHYDKNIIEGLTTEDHLKSNSEPESEPESESESEPNSEPNSEPESESNSELDSELNSKTCTQSFSNTKYINTNSIGNNCLPIVNKNNIDYLNNQIKNFQQMKDRLTKVENEVKANTKALQNIALKANKGLLGGNAPNLDDKST